ncbi:MAG: family 16 glycosylhydrolase, partial [Oscillospiraceae bacterium]
MKAAALILALIHSLNTIAAVPPEPAHDTVVIGGSEYVITFSDEFDGTELDLTKWERCPEWKRQDLNNYWDDSMSRLDGEGNLIIGISYDEKTDRFLTGGVRTKGLFEQAYGYYEIRCTLNNMQGWWTAFWLMGESVGIEDDSGTDGTEIDIFESPYFNDKMIQHTLNWDGYGAAHKYEGVRVPKDVYDGEYHTFGLLWKRTGYTFFIDGVETWHTAAQSAKGTCTAPLYIKVTGETGSWSGLPDKSLLPDEIKVDYVRAYKLNTKG